MKLSKWLSLSLLAMSGVVFAASPQKNIVNNNTKYTITTVNYALCDNDMQCVSQTPLATNIIANKGGYVTFPFDSSHFVKINSINAQGKVVGTFHDGCEVDSPYNSITFSTNFDGSVSCTTADAVKSK